MKTFTCHRKILMVFAFSLIATQGMAQCLTAPSRLGPSTSCAGSAGRTTATVVTSTGTKGAGNRFIDATGTYGFSNNDTDTLRICNGAVATLSAQLKGAVVVESGATLIINNGTASSTTFLVNYGTVKLGTNLTLNDGSGTEAATFINATINSVFDGQSHNLTNSGKIVNNGFMKGINTLTFNNPDANACLGPSSVIKVADIASGSTTNIPFTTSATSNGYLGGCLSFTSSATGNCMAPTTAGTNITFCSATGSSASSSNPCSAPQNAVFGYATLSTTCSACASPLPVTLVNFDATLTKEGVLLDWTTLNAWDSDYFILEHSTDGKTWSVLGTIPVENKNGANQYTFTDYSPAVGLNYYKLSEINNQGRKKEYSIKYITISETSTGFVLYPNPGNGNLNVTITGPYETYDFEITDIPGKTIFRKNLHPGINNLGYFTSVSGLYLARLKIGRDYIVKKLVVQ